MDIQLDAVLLKMDLTTDTFQKIWENLQENTWVDVSF